MKKDILKSLLGWFAIGLIGYFTLGVFAQHADVQTTFSQVAGFVSKLIISPEANQNSIKYIGINEDGNGSLEVYRWYAQVKKANIGDAFVEELGVRWGSFLRYGSNHASSSSEEVLLKYNTPDPGIKWTGSNYDSKIITINAGKNVNFDDVLVIKDNKVWINNPNPQVALDISWALKIGRQWSYGGNLYVGSDNLVYLDGQPIVPFYCGNGYVDSNYVDPIGAPDNVDLEECDNGSTNGDGCSNQCQLETPSVSVSASPSYSNNWSLTTTISASTDSWSKLTRINFGDGGSATLDPPERTSYSTSRTYSTSSPDASWTITVYARNNLEEVRNDIGDNDTDRPTASASTTVRVCNPTACAATDYINRSEGSDTTCRDYGTKHLHRCELWSCVEYDTQSVWRAQNDGVVCSSVCTGKTKKTYKCSSGTCQYYSSTTYPCDGCKEESSCTVYSCKCSCNEDGWCDWEGEYNTSTVYYCPDEGRPSSCNSPWDLDCWEVCYPGL